MDVLTQLEQACDHGSVLISETFAVALRPADSCLGGDGGNTRLLLMTPPSAPLGPSSSNVRRLVAVRRLSTRGASDPHSPPAPAATPSASGAGADGDPLGAEGQALSADFDLVPSLEMNLVGAFRGPRWKVLQPNATVGLVGIT